MSEQLRRKPTVSCPRNGPLVVRGLDVITLVDGTEKPLKRSTSLCRCGQSPIKPFCNGTHALVGFTSEPSPERVADRRDTHVGANITIFDNRGICSHAGHCSDNLPEVFRSGAPEPWIDPDAAPADEIVRIIRMCPSGALSYAVDGVEHRDQDREPAIRVTPHGPYQLTGGITLRGVKPLEGASLEHCTLCRCGNSKNKPFCDGSHWHVGFRDDGRRRIALLSDLTANATKVVELEGVTLEVTRKDDVPETRHPQSGTELTTTVDPRWGEILVELDEVRRLRE